MNTLGRSIKEGETVVLKKGILKDEYDTLEWRTVTVSGDNFGNHDFTAGTCLMVKFKDGEVVRMSGLDIDAKATEKMFKENALLAMAED